MNLHQPLHVLPGVGPKSAEKYAKLGIENLQDLLLYFPFRYEDFKTKQVLELDAEAEILRDAKTDCAAGEENQLGDAVIFGNDGGDAVAVHGKKLLLKRCAFCGKCGIIGKLLAAGDKLMRVRRDPGGFHFMQKSGKAVAYR